MHGLARFLTAILGSIYFHFAMFNTILIEFLSILVELTHPESLETSQITLFIFNSLAISSFFPRFMLVCAVLNKIFSSESSEFLNSVQKVIHNSFIHFRQNGSSFVIPR